MEGGRLIDYYDQLKTKTLRAEIKAAMHASKGAYVIERFDVYDRYAFERWIAFCDAEGLCFAHRKTPRARSGVTQAFIIWDKNLIDHYSRDPTMKVFPCSSFLNTVFEVSESEGS